MKKNLGDKYLYNDYMYNSITFTFTAEKFILKVCIYVILLG